MPALRAVLRACAAGALALAAACADSTSAPVQPVPGVPNAPGDPTLVRLACTADLATRTVRCDAPGAAAGGPRADRIYGSGTGMKVTSSNIAIVADSFTFDMTVTNNLEYPVGTTDGLNADPNGIRVFFVDGIHTTAGTGNVTVANADGVDAFTAAGQAYFAYHGILQPGATTAARKWKLRFDAGVQQFSFGLYISTPVPPGGGTVGLTILQPGQNNIAIDSVLVRVRIDAAPAPIQSVKAYLGDQVRTMTPYSPGLVQASFPVAGLPFGFHQIRVHAVTVRADTGNAYVTFRTDAVPTLTVSGPRPDYVARPTLRLDISCVDDDPAGCASVTAKIGGVLLASGTSGIHTDVSLASMDETRPVIQIDALDSGGHALSTSVRVIVESRPTLTFVDSAGSKAVDVDATRLLFTDSAQTAWLRDRVGGTRTLVQTVPYTFYEILDGQLHSQGAIFHRRTQPSERVFEWRAGAFVDLNLGVTTASPVIVEGEWAAWRNGSQVVRRDLSAGTTLSFAGGHPDIAANGDLVYESGSTVRRLRTGVTTTIDAGAVPVTDGINVAYVKSSQVWMWDGGTPAQLSNTLVSVVPHVHYETAGGWVAYSMADGAGNSQLRTRAPDGTHRQVTLFGTTSQLRAFSADGTVVFANAGAMYVIRAPYTATPTRIGPDWFRATFRGSELLLFLGNTVFRFDY